MYQVLHVMYVMKPPWLSDSAFFQPYLTFPAIHGHLTTKCRLALPQDPVLVQNVGKKVVKVFAS